MTVGIIESQKILPAAYNNAPKVVLNAYNVFHQVLVKKHFQKC